MDPMSDVFDASETLGVDLEQLSWNRALAVLRWIQGFLDPSDPSQTQLLEMLRDRRDGDPDLLAGLPAGLLPTTNPVHAPDQLLCGSNRDPTRKARTVPKTTLPDSLNRFNHL
jgi:hypothetical protein